MEDPITAAQDDTAPAGGEALPGGGGNGAPPRNEGSGAQEGGAPAGAPDTPGDGGAEQTPAEEKPAGEKKPVTTMGSLLDEDGDEEGGKDGERDGEDAGGEYSLTFPEGVVADPEALKVFTAAGKEHGLKNGAMQRLAEIGTEHAMKQVEATIAGAEKRFREMRLADKAATKQAWGAHFDACRTEAGLGLARMEKEGRIPAEVRGGDLQFLLDKTWFLDMLREDHRRHTEQPGTMGDRSGGGGGGDDLGALYPGLEKKKK